MTVTLPEMKTRKPEVRRGWGQDLTSQTQASDLGIGFGSANQLKSSALQIELRLGNIYPGQRKVNINSSIWQAHHILPLVDIFSQPL